MIVDTDGASCVTAAFVFGGDSVEREYDIRVLQYEADNEMGGPPGCLQFLLGTVAAPHGGTVTSFNWVNPEGKHAKLLLWLVSTLHFFIDIKKQLMPAAPLQLKFFLSSILTNSI